MQQWSTSTIQMNFYFFLLEGNFGSQLDFALKTDHFHIYFSYYSIATKANVFQAHVPAYFSLHHIE